MKRKKFLMAAVVASLTISLAACGNPGTGGAAENKNLSGTVRMAGSTSMETLANALSEGFMTKNGNIIVTTEFIGSSAGIEGLVSGSADIGMASRGLKDSEKSKGVVENVVAIDGIAVITDTANTVKNLTKAQLVEIYKGKIRNWSEVGGKDASIVVVGREAGSGTRSAFEELLGIENACQYANELDSTGAVMAKVAATPGAIGYVSLDVLDDSVQAFKLDGVEGTPSEILAGNYMLSRPFVMATNGPVEAQSEVVQSWFAYIRSEEGRQIIEKIGLILPE